MRLLQVVFAAVAAVSAVAFARAVRDGESRRDPDAMIALLRPEYSGRNRLAPDFELPDRSGRRFRLSAYRGRTVVVHFWTRTCGPCVEEMAQGIPAFDEIIRGRRDIALLLVTVDAGWAAISPLVPSGLRSPILFDPQRRVVARQYGTRLFPETWVIDPRGVIRARFDHAIDWAQPLFIDYLSALR